MHIAHISIYIYIYIYTHTHDQSLLHFVTGILARHARVRVPKRKYIHTYIYIYVYKYTHSLVPVPRQAQFHTSKCIHIYMCVCTYICMHVRMSVCTHVCTKYYSRNVLQCSLMECTVMHVSYMSCVCAYIHMHMFPVCIHNIYIDIDIYICI